MIPPRTFWNSILDPRNFLTASISVAVLGMLVSYVEVQSSAEREMALRQGSPAAVAVQSFSPSQDMGPASEVLVYGEIDLDLARGVATAEDAEAGRILAVPVFPLSDLGQNLARPASSGGASRAPGPNDRGDGKFPDAVALVILPDGEGSLANEAYFMDSALGRGAYGKVVLLNGQRSRDWDGVSVLARDALQASGIRVQDGFLVIDPFLAGRIAALTVTDPRHSPMIIWVAVGLFGFAALLQMRQSLRPVPATPILDEEPLLQDPQDDTPDARTHKFARIPSQREIRRAEAARAEAERPPHWTETTSAAMRVVGAGLGRGLSALVRRIRNRR